MNIKITKSNIKYNHNSAVGIVQQFLRSSTHFICLLYSIKLAVLTELVNAEHTVHGTVITVNSL